MHPRHALIPTSVGALTVVVVDEHVAGVFFPHHRHLPGAATLGDRVAVAASGVFGAVAEQVAEYLAGERTAFDLPLRTAGEPFQERVWAHLRQIPYGETVTYGQLAAALGGPNLARAVGTAVGRNPISIIIPCHRVVGSDGSLTGYAGGMERKAALLRLEEPAEQRAARLF